MSRVFFLLSLLQTLTFVAADTQKNSMVAEWIVLAHNLHRGNSGYFHTLPLDIQTNIFSRIHPAPSLDDWQSNNMLCVKSIVVPYCIKNFDINGDRLAFITPKKDKDNQFQPGWIDLNTNRCRMLCEEAIGFYDPNDAKIHLSDDTLFFDDYLYEKPSKESHKKVAFAAHKKKPLCAIIDVNMQGGIEVDIYDNGKICNTYTIPGVPGHAEQSVFRWHNKLNYLYKYDPSMSSIHLLDLNKKSERPCIKAFHIECPPHFSPDGDFFYAKHPDGLLVHNIDSARNTFHIISDEKKNFLLRGVGHSTYLAEITEITDTQGTEKKSYVLRKFDDHAGIPLTELNYAPALHKLPSGDDYRYVTIASDETKGSSKIEIFVPKTMVMFQHYCMLQAALAAQKSGDTKDRALFTAPQQATLVQETKTGYPVFDHLMAKKVSKE